ncbi:hypothetical protein LB523_11910 [Mesorhizobium sp. ESP-6-4]|uniref:hypothetical protein n=1 Tax=Mesorhizobium sp. ESP-6-4 TaxID=2876624 RepID=UPI001CCDA9F7|nr:hypothetical protein [Mesorhizobium sp. ESP-6-4]MBZ9659750.1 hypothetical protein [Mesorhizobium sp. ESP-6-4]
MEYVKAEFVPDYDDSLTAGKAYQFVRHEDDSRPSGFISNDYGMRCFILLSGCAHLDGLDWTLCDKFGGPA